MKAWIMLMLALSLPVAALGEEAKEGAAPKVSYISLSPPFVGNYGLDGTPKLKVYKADVALRVTGDASAQAVKANPRQPVTQAGLGPLERLVVQFAAQMTLDVKVDPVLVVQKRKHQTGKRFI